MYKNIGKKIKVLAYVLCIIGIVAGILLGISMIVNYTYYEDDAIATGVLLGIVSATLIGVISWVGSFSLYGYGQHIEDTQAIRRIIESEQRKKLTENSD